MSILVLSPGLLEKNDTSQPASGRTHNGVQEGAFFVAYWSSKLFAAQVNHKDTPSRPIQVG